MVKLLYGKKKELRKQLKAVPVDKQSYEDIEVIREKISQSITLPKDFVEPIRVKLVRTEPYYCYRVSIICDSREKRLVRNKDGSNSLVFAGKYIWKQFWVQACHSGEFVFDPPITKDF